MSVFQRPGRKTWWFEFEYRGRRYRESAGTRSKTLAIEIERKRRREVEEADSAHARKQRELDFWWEINLARHPGPAAAQRKSGNRRLQPSRPL